MKVAIRSLPISFSFIVLLMAALLVLSGCQRQKAADVVYRAQQGAKEAAQSAAAGQVKTSEEAGVPKFTQNPKTVKIGLLLPLSGPQATIGAQMRDAALMALYDAIDNAPRIDAKATPEIVIKDTQGQPDQAKKAAQQLVEEQVDIIIGPLLADNVEAAAPVARAAEIAMVSLSNDMRMRQPGVFIFGFVPEHQVKRIARYAVLQQIKHYSAIATQDEYGRMVIRDLSNYLADYQHTLQPVEFIPPGRSVEAGSIVRVADYIKNIGRERKAVFLPVTGPALEAVAAQLSQNEKVNNGYLKLLGTGMWDKRETIGSPGLLGAWFSTTPPDKSLRHNERFFTQYGYEPSRVASLAYDAVHLAAHEGIQNGPMGLSAMSLVDVEEFRLPANGQVRFYEDGTVERGLVIVEVGVNGFRVIEGPKFPQN